MAPQWAFAWEVVHRTALDAVAVQRVVRRNVPTAGGQVLTVREQRSKRDAMAAPRAAWESVHRTAERWRCSRRKASGSVQTTLSKLPRPHDLCTPTLLLSGQSR
jgi:hypothetical protein